MKIGITYGGGRLLGLHDGNHGYVIDTESKEIKPHIFAYNYDYLKWSKKVLENGYTLYKFEVSELTVEEIERVFPEAFL